MGPRARLQPMVCAALLIPVVYYGQPCGAAHDPPQPSKTDFAGAWTILQPILYLNPYFRQSAISKPLTVLDPDLSFVSEPLTVPDSDLSFVSELLTVPDPDSWFWFGPHQDSSL
jgi:hypothetical protein